MTESRGILDLLSKNISRSLLLLSIAVLVFVSLIDPADDIFHLKVPAFGSVILLGLYRRGLTNKLGTNALWMVTLSASLVIPLAWTVFGLLNNNIHDSDGPFGMLKSFLFLMIVPVLVIEDIDLSSLLIHMGVLIATLTVAMIVVFMLSPIMFLVLYEFSMEKQNAIITSSRDLFGVGVGQFYYKTSPLMIFPFSHYCSRLFQQGEKIWGPLLMALFYAVALLLSGTRANVLAALFVVAAFAILRIYRSGGGVLALTISVLAGVTLLATVIPKFADTSEVSNSVKLQHAHSYQQEFTERPATLFWGEGIGTSFYSEGFQDWTTLTELSYLEIIRVFGMPLMILYSAGLLWITYSLFSNQTYALGFAFLAYLAISGSNPLLISSTGFLVICAVWKEAVKQSGPQSVFNLPQALMITLPETIPVR